MVIEIASKLSAAFEDMNTWLTEGRKVGAVGDRSAYDAAVAFWVTAGESQPGVLRPLLDQRTIPALIEVKYPRSQGTGFFLPVLGAWALLALMENLYQRTDLTVSFFGWWSAQGWLGPSLYSGVIAILLALVLLHRMSVTKGQQFADKYEAGIVQRAALISVISARLIDDGERALTVNHSALDLSKSARELSDAAASLRVDSRAFAEFAEAAVSAEHAAATSRDAVAELGTVTEQVGTQVRILSSVLERLPAAMAQWEGRLNPLHAALQELTDLVAKTQANTGQVDNVLQHTAALLASIGEIAAQAKDAAEATASAVPGLDRSTGLLHEALTVQRASQDQTKELIADAAELAVQLRRLAAFADDGAKGHTPWPARLT